MGVAKVVHVHCTVILHNIAVFHTHIWNSYLHNFVMVITHMISVVTTANISEGVNNAYQ